MFIATEAVDSRGREVDILVQHKGVCIEFGQIKMGTNETWKPAALYAEVNEFFATLSDKEADELFALYVEADSVMCDTRPSEYQALLGPIMVKIVDKYCSIERMSKFIPTLNIEIPSKIPEGFDTETSRKNRAQTYTRREYLGLMCLMSVVRCIHPIWIAYRASLNSGSRESDIYVLIDSIRLIGRSEFLDSEEVTRFMQFTEAVYASKIGDNEDTGVLDGVSSDLIQFYIFASSVLDKLLTMPLTIGDHNTHLITKCYHKVEQDCKSLPAKFRSKVIRRDTPRNASDDSKTSWMDIFTTKQRVPSSYYIKNEIYLRNIETVRDHLDPAIPMWLVEDCLDGFKELDGLPILGANHRIPLHQTLVQWIMYDIIQIRTVPNIDRRSILNAMAVSQAFLIHYELLDVAKLFSIYPVAEETNEISMNIPSTALKNELLKYCPRKSQLVPKDPISSNIFMISIDALTSRLIDYKWELKTSDKMLRNLNYRENDKKIDPTIKDGLSRMFIKLMEMKKCRTKAI